VTSTLGDDIRCLEAHDLRVHFEGLRALDGVDLCLNEREILGLIGPNGAGKTTLVNTLSGFQRPTAGRIALSGTDITRSKPHQRARQGLVRTFQNIRLFGSLTVFENVEASALGLGLARVEARRRASQVLERLRLDTYTHAAAAGLPHGHQRRLGIARALVMRPSFLLLDEPAAGLNERESALLVETLAGIRNDFGCALLVIEHDMQVIMRLCDRIQVLDHGRTISTGTPVEVREDPAVLEAYLGSEGGRVVA
jgi:branched-chain amino acid transport system ATP-binding protein